MGLERLQEACVLCRKDTAFWHRATNQPVCASCAATHGVEDLPKKATRSQACSNQEACVG